MNSQPRPAFPDQQQSMPGSSQAMNPQPDCGEDSYQGTARLRDKKAIITGADSGIGQAVALAFEREGADVLARYYSEHDDARETQRLVEAAGRQCVLWACDIKDPGPVARSLKRPSRVRADQVGQQRGAPVLVRHNVRAAIAWLRRKCPTVRYEVRATCGP